MRKLMLVVLFVLLGTAVWGQSTQQYVRQIINMLNTVATIEDTMPETLATTVPPDFWYDTASKLSHPNQMTTILETFRPFEWPQVLPPLIYLFSRAVQDPRVTAQEWNMLKRLTLMSTLLASK